MMRWAGYDHDRKFLFLFALFNIFNALIAHPRERCRRLLACTFNHFFRVFRRIRLYKKFHRHHITLFHFPFLLFQTLVDDTEPSYPSTSMVPLSGNDHWNLGGCTF